MNKIITDELIDEVLGMLVDGAGIRGELVSFEIQDEYQFLLISINAEELPSDYLSGGAIEVARMLDRFMPMRNGSYSWMLNFTKNGFVVESFFGGDSESPDSGIPFKSCRK